MTQSHEARRPFEVHINPVGFNLMQQGAQQVFEKRVEDLNFDEAARLVCDIFFNSEQIDSKGMATREGITIIDSTEDGKEAFEGYMRQYAKRLAPKIDDEREIVLNITRNPTLMDVIRNRDPKVKRTYRFRNEPPQYA